tara:strand:+ start:4655 stop:5383 length:729 start_codon:yes stop_codon:yes gene_type:complete
MSLEDTVQSMVNDAVAAAQGEQPDPLTTDDVESIVNDVLSHIDLCDYGIDDYVESALSCMDLSDYVDIESDVYSAITNYIYEGCGEMDEAGAHIMKRGAYHLNHRNNEFSLLTRNEYNEIMEWVKMDVETVQDLHDLNAGLHLEVAELTAKVDALLEVINVPDQTPPTDEEVVIDTISHFNGDPAAFNAKVLEMYEARRAPFEAMTKAELVHLADITDTVIDKWGRKADIIDALLAAGVDVA